ncbi:NUMOD3 domain-containing DNA-binding protein [Eoetvoesiella caeni]|uniref:Group I intron endonuclease n=1 Tax=Eoetvoesiella caeni TaxID=645616 RepID=A0A366HCJ3_9BURK|nr:NUMOD3 domain-containing DNA-binding protein [Eoetvoesiella caeni]MCI2809387.1 GIY-YIG nuclease family protein [Eoetvoesiella caeni]NYT54528.1 GIY-YIG nuclease family protein [Eoetvoesiella caeni]RBP39282.1 group I intron endonuclease [Eoetvoesiella caeni]
MATPILHHVESDEYLISGVYAIRNRVTGDFYVGSSKNIRNRWAVHKYQLSKGTHGSSRLRNAWGEYGEAAFEFLLLKIVLGSRAEIYAAEQQYLDSFKPSYNISASAIDSSGVVPSEEARRKMSEARSGEKNYWFGVKGPANPAYGRKQPERLKALLSEMRKGEKNPMYGITPPHAKLTDDQVRQVRALLAEGRTMASIAEAYGVSIGAINHIKHGRSYVRVA